MTNEGNPNADWNPVWFVRTGRFEGGWTVEMAIPFRSIRYVSGPNQEWGIQLRRSIRRKNEWTHLTFVPAVSSNFRFRWEYQPGSEIFVVYTDERDTTVAGYPGLRNKAFVVKVNRLFRF